MPLTKEPIDDDNIFLIHDFLTIAQCHHFIQISENAGFADAPIAPLFQEYRNNERVTVDDLALANELFERAKPFLISPFMSKEVLGLNERFRYYRYDVGQRFAPHYDGHFERANGERSEFTFILYLNDDFQGGETRFYLGERRITIAPRRGTALVFYHDQMHEGAPVEKGRKYVLRTDVMYAPTSH